MQTTSKIFVAGHTGLVGSAMIRKLHRDGYENLVHRTHQELDLRRQEAVEAFFSKFKPEYVFLCAAKVGGIWGNKTRPADFIYDNLAIQTNVIHAAYVNNVRKLLFLGSSCIYPKHCPQPMREGLLLSGPLEETNESYAIAKIAGIKMCESYNRQLGTCFISAMPTNLYGPNDNFNLETSHVLPAFIRKFHDAKEKGAQEVEIWGTGKPKREFLHVDDLASACLFLMNNYEDKQIINIGTGQEISIAGLASLVADIVGFQGSIRYEADFPDGTPRKLLDVSRLETIGWKAEIGLREGIESTYQWYLEHEDSIRQ